MILISEIGNCHAGDFNKFKEMIRISKECGATLCKSQAFIGKDIKGSMPSEFYTQCQFQYEQYLEAIWYAREVVGIDLFYSFFSKKLEPIAYHQRWHKYAASQVDKKLREIEKRDAANLIVSIKEAGIKPKLKLSNVLHVSPYLANNPGLENIKLLKEWYNMPIGYSDHTVGVEWCEKAYKEYNSRIIEKHFTLTRDIYFDGIQYRDAVHSATPEEMYKLAKTMGR